MRCVLDLTATAARLSGLRMKAPPASRLTLRNALQVLARFSVDLATGLTEQQVLEVRIRRHGLQDGHMHSLCVVTLAPSPCIYPLFKVCSQVCNGV